MNIIRICSQLSTRPAIAWPLPTPIVFELLKPICEAITPAIANGMETKQHMKKVRGDNTESDIETMPRTIPAVADPFVGRTAIIMPCGTA